MFVIVPDLRASVLFADFKDERGKKWLRVINTYDQKPLIKSYRWKPLETEAFLFDEIRLRLYKGGIQKIDIIFKSALYENLSFIKDFKRHKIGIIQKRRFKAHTPEGIVRFLRFFTHRNILGDTLKNEILKARGE